MSSTRYFENPYLTQQHVYTGSRLDVHMPRILDIVNRILKGINQPSDAGKGGIYVGTAGIAYALYYLDKSGLFPAQRNEFLMAAKSCIESALENIKINPSSSRKKIGFLHGDGGVHAISALVYHHTGDKEASTKHLNIYRSAAVDCKRAEFDELFVGRAGYLLGVLLLQRDLKTEILPDNVIEQILREIIQTGEQCSSQIKVDGDLPLMYEYHDKMYLGAAHGFSGILQVLLCFPQVFNYNPQLLKMIQQSVDYLLSRCVERGGNYNIATNLESSLSADGGKHLVHWCHGASGVVYTFAKAYLVFNRDPKYLDACIKLAETVWKLGLLKKGPGICHGVAGSGYVFLLLYRLTGDTKYLYRADRFAEFIFSDEFSKARKPDRQFSLFEGLAGTACYLCDMLQPDKAEFPLADIFQ